MFTEKRRQLRVDTYIPTEMTVIDATKRLSDYFAELREERSDFRFEESKKLYGYIENLSEGGIGVISLDPLLPGAQVVSNFGPSETQIISPSASLVYSRINGYFHYYGFKFTMLGEKEQMLLKGFIKSLHTIQLKSNKNIYV
jgi:hypothetical protein